MRKVFLTLAMLLLCAGAALFALSRGYYQKAFGRGAVTDNFEVQTGESFAAVAHRLADKKLINQPQLLNVIARFYGLRGKLRKGEYALSDAMSPYEILQVLTSGKSINYPFTITEGLNSYEVALNFEKKGFGKKEDFLRACADGALLKNLLQQPIPHCEGYLFPDTYHFERHTSATQMIETMVRAFVKNYQTVSQGRNLGGWSRHQILTFASLIEKETGAAEERPLIASVFFNRMHKGMRLQTDPTVQYGVLAETGVFPTNITKKDLETRTPYNTYTQEGLPPGPISNPGRAAMKAVFEPVSSEYLFFVSRNDGTHVFTRNFDDHKKAVREFQLNPKAREGKSWRDLQK